MTKTVPAEPALPNSNTNVRTVLIIHVPSEWRTTNRRWAFRSLANVLPERTGVLCVNRPIDAVVAPIKRPRKFWSGCWRTKVENDSPRINIVTPRLAIHEILAPKVPGAESINRRLMGTQLRRTLNRLFPEANRIIQWIHHPVQRWVFDVFPDGGKVYHCYDEYTCTSDGVFHPERWQPEVSLLREADLTFVTSRGLLPRRSALARRLEILPNGFPEFFLESREACPDPIDSIPHPRIGYVGNVFSLLEFQMLERVFSRRREWQMVFIGPIQRESLVRELRRLPNVHFLGLRHHEDLPGLLSRIDVALVPIVINGFTRALSPLKLFEYIGAGVPVVSTAFPDLEHLGSVVRLVPNQPEAFETAIAETLSEDRSVHEARLRAEAKRHTWTVINRQRVVPVLRDVFGF